MEKTFIIDKNVRDNVKIYGAIIEGFDDRYFFKRNFKSYRILKDCSSNFAYYNYYIDVKENEIIEISKKSKYKNKKEYFILENNFFLKKTVEEIFNILKKR